MDESGQATADWALVERVKAGEDEAFTVLMGRYRRPILNFVFRMIGDVAAAEDLAQDVFVSAYRQLRKPAFHQKRGAAFSSWLFQVARHAALDYLRHRKRHPTESLERLEDKGETTPSAGTTAAEALAAHELGEQIAAAVAHLPPDQRTAIVLSEYENLSYAQIAAIMTCSEKSVESRLYRARQALRKRLAPLLAQDESSAASFLRGFFAATAFYPVEAIREGHDVR